MLLLFGGVPALHALDATLGMVSIQQNDIIKNDIIKIVSVAAVVLLPPTLIASVYGMNFEHMPELQWVIGYPIALLLMVLSALLPYLYFRRRGGCNCLSSGLASGVAR